MTEVYIPRVTLSIFTSLSLFPSLLKSSKDNTIAVSALRSHWSYCLCLSTTGSFWWPHWRRDRKESLLNCKESSILEYEQGACICLVFHQVLCTVSDPEKRRGEIEAGHCLLHASYHTLSPNTPSTTDLISIASSVGQGQWISECLSGFVCVCKAGRRDGPLHPDPYGSHVPKAVCCASALMSTVMLMWLVSLLAPWEADKRVSLKVFQGKPSIQFVDVNGIRECKIVLRVWRRPRLWMDWIERKESTGKALQPATILCESPKSSVDHRITGSQASS